MSAAAMEEISSILSVLESHTGPTQEISTNLISPVKTEATIESATSTVSVAPNDSDERPSHSYVNLIVMALMSMPGRQGSLHEIYQFISGRFTYYTKNRKHWKNSVRHNLALHKCFKRLDTDADHILGPKGKRPKVSPLWALVSNPAEMADRLTSRKCNLNKENGPKKRKSGQSKATKNSPSAKKAKTNSTGPKPQVSPTSTTPCADPLTKIAMMLPEIGSGDPVSSSSSSPSSHPLELVQPPLTPESDYGSLSSDYSPYIPGQSCSANSTGSVFEYSTCAPSPSVQDRGFSPYIPGRPLCTDNTSKAFEYPATFTAPPSVQNGGPSITPLPHLSVEDICAVLQCDDCLPESPDSGTGVDLLDGFGWFDEPTQPRPQPQHPYPTHHQCLADSLLDNRHQVTGDFGFNSEPAAISFYVPKVPVEQPISVDTNFVW